MRNCASEGARSASPESISPHVLWPDGFSDVQLHIVVLATRAPEWRDVTNWHDGQNFCLPETQITGTSYPSRPGQRGVRTSRTWDGDAVDAEAAPGERGGCVRQKRVVPTSQCWRQCSWVLDISGRYGGKRAVLRGERAISRKAIAQGMSDVLRCPVCSCACS